MKNLLFIFILMGCFAANAQDLIILNTGDTLKARVVTKSTDDLFYEIMGRTTLENKRHLVYESIPLIKVKFIIYADKRIEFITGDLPPLTAGDHIFLAGKNYNTAIILSFISMGVAVITPILALNDDHTYNMDNLYAGYAISGLFSVLSVSFHISGNQHLKKGGILLNGGIKPVFYNPNTGK